MEYLRIDGSRSLISLKRWTLTNTISNVFLISPGDIYKTLVQNTPGLCWIQQNFNIFLELWFSGYLDGDAITDVRSFTKEFSFQTSLCVNNMFVLGINDILSVLSAWLKILIRKALWTLICIWNLRKTIGKWMRTLFFKSRYYVF